MGLGDAGGGGGGSKVAAPATVSCSICLEVVSENGDRSLANLQCGHQFHLDCIGSAFNIKGAMQCPNCRKIEKGQWLYAHGSRALPEFSMDDWAHDEDMYDLSYSEMAFGVRWCPFSGLTRLPSSFDEGEFSSSAYHDLLGHHAIFTEHTTVPSTNHPCPYIAYVGPIHPSSSASNSSASVADGSNFNNHWSGPSVDPNSYAFPSMDLHYRHPSPFATTTLIGGADQPSIPARSTSNIPRNGMHPFILGHSSGGRAPAPSSAVTSSMVPPYPGTVARPRSSLQAYFQQQSTRRSSQSHRGLPQIPPIATSSDPSSGFYFFSSSSSGRTFQEAENPHRDRVHVDRDSIWGPFHPSSSFRQRRTSERMPSHNQR